VTTASTAARQGVLVVEQPLATLVLTGSDGREWLNGLLTCDVKAVEPGAGAWGLLLSKQGKIVGDVNVVAGSDALYLAVQQRAADTLLTTLNQFLIMEDAELTAPSSEFGWLTLHGPRAAELAKAIVPPGGAWGAIDWTGLGGAAVVAPAGEVQAALAAAAAYRDAEVVLGSSRQSARRVARAPRGLVDQGLLPRSRGRLHAGYAGQAQAPGGHPGARLARSARPGRRGGRRRAERG
jgi:folate-binding Fe-S cluster repair protein YgfZ